MTRHAIERAKQRYGLDLTPQDIASLEQRIEAGDIVSQRPSNVGMLIQIAFAGSVLFVCWHVFARQIVTIYPIKACRDLRKRPRHLSRAIRAAARAEAEYEREGL